MDLAEVQTIHKAIAVASNKMNELFSALHLLSNSINTSREILQAREHALKNGIAGYKKRKDPINNQRAGVGLKKIGTQIDYRSKTGGARSQRTDLLGGTGLKRPQEAPRRPAPPVAEDTAMDVVTGTLYVNFSTGCT